MAEAARPAQVLIIMVREPRMGAVKTRLAREIGQVAATRFYRSTTSNLIRRLASDPRWRTVIAITPDRAISAPFWSRCFARIGQGRGDLGRRMERLLFSQGRLPVVVIGSDIPAVQPHHIAQAFALLRRRDAVFGPAEDGGFWLVGVNPKLRLRGLFTGVRWSSPNTLSEVLDKMSAWRVGFAARLSDVDDESSYRRYAHLGARLTPPARYSSS